MFWLRYGVSEKISGDGSCKRDTRGTIGTDKGFQFPKANYEEIDQDQEYSIPIYAASSKPSLPLA